MEGGIESLVILMVFEKEAVLRVITYSLFD
jgi:hypothetical protein